MSATGRPIVVLGMIAKIPVPGVIWQTIHYLIGLRALGLEPTTWRRTHGRRRC